MWSKEFFQDASWRAFRTFIQAVAGGLVASNTISAFDAPWYGLIGAGLVASVLSLAQSVDRERAVTYTIGNLPTATAPVQPLQADYGCGTDLR